MRTISQTWLFVVSLLAPLTSQAQVAQARPSQCIVVVNTYQPSPGDELFSSLPKSVKAVTRNDCTEAIDARVCLERDGGSSQWDCGVESNWAPGAIKNWYTAQGTRRLWKSARRAGATTPLGNPNQT